MSFQCEFCTSTFKRRADLNKHRRSAKYCLKLREPQQKNVYICAECDKTFTRKDNLKRHQVSCNQGQGQGPDQCIEGLRQEIINLMVLQNGGARRNSMTNNLEPITNESIQEYLDRLNLNFIVKGAKGFAIYANVYPFNGRIVCTDRSRKKLQYKDENGEVVNDSGGVKLAQRFFQVTAARNEELINAEYTSIQQEVETIAKEERGYTANLTGLLTRATQLQDTLRLCKQAALGDENELTEGFIRHLTKLL